MKLGFFFCTLTVVFLVSFVADDIAACEASEILEGDSRWYGTHPEPLYTISLLDMPSYLDSTGVVDHMQTTASSWSQENPWFDFQENGENQAFVNAYTPWNQQTNHNNLIGWDDWPPLVVLPDGTLAGTLGATLVCKTQTQGSSGRWLIDFVHTSLNWDIDGLNYGVYFWSLDPAPSQPGNYQFDVQSIAAHEFGHWLKLTHTPSYGYPSFPTMEQLGDLYDLAGSTEWRSLECEDIWGLNEIYDGTSSAPLSLPQMFIVI